MQELLNDILKDIDSTKELIRKLNEELSKTHHTSKVQKLHEKIMVAEDMLQDLHIRAAWIEKYLKESENRK